MSAVRSGQATDWEDPYPERGRCKVGGRAVWVWRLKKDSEDINPDYETLRDAAKQGAHVHCEGGEREGQTKDGKKFTTFTAWDVRVAESALNGSGGEGKGEGPATPRSIPGVNTAREHFSDDRQRIIGARWALKAAINISLAPLSGPDFADRGIPASFVALPVWEKAKQLRAWAEDIANGPEQRALPENPPEPATVPEGWGE